MTTERPSLSGLHHVTAIASDPARNLAFYTEVLGQRLVKKTVNFDDPGTYHFYFGNHAGEPGSILTFFPWPGARRGRSGAGQATVTSYSIPEGSAGYWHDRLRAQGVAVEEAEGRFSEPGLDLADPDGLRIRLVQATRPESGPAWAGGDEPVDARHALGGFRSVTLASPRPEATRDFLTETLGLVHEATDADVERYAFPSGAAIDLVPDHEFGESGAGTVHHIAFRVDDDETELAWQKSLRERGVNVSPVMDRQYFHSIYFREPGGVLFEIATDPPGFTADEPLETLGEGLRLPPPLESRREQIEALLPAV